MKTKLKIIKLIIFILILLINTKSFAALQSVPATKTDGSEVITNVTVSDSFDLCKNMTKRGESLYGASVLPHLATNKDWGAVAYLSNSIYGTNGEGENTGKQITIKTEKDEGIEYYSTNGNVTGVMNWGSNPNKTLYTQTSSLLTLYTGNDEWLSQIIENKNTRYVENITTGYGKGVTSDSTGMALEESRNFTWSDLVCDSHIHENCPICTRGGLFGFSIGNANMQWSTWGLASNGSAKAKVTFRPVIWNK